MTKPNDFILNSDYLALAQTSTSDLTAYFGAETFSPGQAYDRTQDFVVPEAPASVDMCLISLNDGNYTLGSHYVISSNQPILHITVYRLNATTLRVKLHEFNSQAGGYYMPTQKVKIKVASFKPPNIF